MNDCLNVLDTSPEAAPTDKKLIAWIRIQRLVEECAIAFSLDDPGNTASLCDNSVQQMLKGFKRQLEDLMKSMKATPGVLDGEYTTAVCQTQPNKIGQGSLKLISTSITYMFMKLRYIQSMILRTSGHLSSSLPQVQKSGARLDRRTYKPLPSVSPPPKPQSKFFLACRWRLYERCRPCCMFA